MKNIMKRFCLLLVLAAIVASGCEPSAQKTSTMEKPTVESVSQKIEDTEESLKKTEELLIKRIAERDSVKAAILELIRRTDKTPKEIQAELVKAKSSLDSQLWFTEIKETWSSLKDLERDVVVFTRQEARLNKSKVKLEQLLDKLKRDEENKSVYIPGEDPEMDKLIIQNEVDAQISEFNRLSSGEQREIDIVVNKLMDETMENSVSNIPGLKLKSIDELPPFPDIAAEVQPPSAPAQKSLFSRVKKECNEIVNQAQKEAEDYLKENQPEAACACWLGAVKQIKVKINIASDQIEAKTFDDYLNSLDACQNGTLLIMCKPYQQTISRFVNDLENKDPDWEPIAEALEGLLRIHPNLTLSETESLETQLEIIRTHLAYLMKQNNRDVKVISQRLETIFGKIDNTYIKELPRKAKADECYNQAVTLRNNKQYETALDRISEALVLYPNKLIFQREKQTIETAMFSTEDKKAGDRAVKVINGVKFAFRYCPPGAFTMGAHGQHSYHEQQQFKATISKGFWILETEVTQKQWEAVMGSNPSIFKGDNFPVFLVSWNDCQEFCKKCTELGLPVQLPTEAQWEYAERAGKELPAPPVEELATVEEPPVEELATVEEAPADWLAPVEEADELPNYRLRVIKSWIRPVGESRNDWGVCDMHSNVKEWCADWYGEYPSGSVTDPTGLSSGSSRVVRGNLDGSRWDYYGCSLCDRFGRTPDIQEDNLGFRVVKCQ